MKCIILLILIITTACSSGKVTNKNNTSKKVKNPTERYFQKKLASKRKQLAYIY